MALAEAIARPAPITDDPTYSGCATQRYGPDTVTSLDLRKCPAAQIRIASPHAAIDMPISRDSGVGCARTSTRTPKTNPSATRKRANVLITRYRDPPSDTFRLRTEPPLDGVEHFGHLDVEQAHAIARAAPQVMTLTCRVARHGDVERRHRTVARRTRRSVDADNRRAQRGGDMRRTRVARYHQRGLARERDDIGDRRVRRLDGGAVRGGDDAVGEPLLARPPQHH